MAGFETKADRAAGLREGMARSAPVPEAYGMQKATRGALELTGAMALWFFAKVLRRR